MWLVAARRSCTGLGYIQYNNQPFVARYTRITLSKRYFQSHASARQGTVQALTGYAFAGKPRSFEKDREGENDESITSQKQLQRQGFSVDSPIGKWTDVMLKGGESGEDALSVTKMKEEGDWFMAVADGVGGWSENGIDPALFSQSLIYHASMYAQKFYACPDRLEAEDLGSTSSSTSKQESGTPTDILQYAYQSTLKQAEVPAGSATACFLTFDSSKGILRSANLGDSGFMVLRPGSANSGTNGAKKRSKTQNKMEEIEKDEYEKGLHVVQFQSKPQTHGFNTPLQLSKLPPEYRFDGSIDSKPSNADSFTCKLMDGDIVLAATDGFWDNVSTSEVLQLIAFIRQKHRVAWLDRMSDISIDDVAEERDLANVIAHNLLQYALMCQFSTTKTSPFEREAARFGIHYPGGKVDDVAILTALIVER